MRRRAKVAVVLGGLLLASVAVVAGPIAYVETACRGEAVQQDFRPAITDPSWQRPEARTFLTYPEWHMVFAYEEFAQVLKTGDEHSFGYWDAVRSFWSSYCTLNRLADAHGGADWPTRQMVYVIGTSFNVEMGLKATYEETVGRLTAALRGPEKTAQDELAAAMAAEYAAFLHQVPWYRFPFAAWANRLSETPTEGLRAWERRIALGTEWRAKQLYADAIAGAAAAAGPDELRMRSVVADLPAETLASIPGVSVVTETETRTVVETDRYAAFTDTLRRISAAGGRVVEIAGNDDVMLSVVGAVPAGVRAPARVLEFTPMYDGRVRSLVLAKADDLAAIVRGAGEGGYSVEHVFDY